MEGEAKKVVWEEEKERGKSENGRTEGEMNNVKGKRQREEATEKEKERMI